ncbi:LuxR C-terminal-related transcriptional regulator [Paenarthrobacter sp. 2TAF44]|uniref:LuxR C-terminal-related transcriptional regulator n=1 Tax=Paenarthrobacter sp. 2TAF44 TaxID=3233018 RepID=UPI003F9B1686
MTGPQKANSPLTDTFEHPPASSNEALASPIARVLEFVERGVSVRVVGQPGSGRSTVARYVASSLKKTGARVHVIGGIQSLGSVQLFTTRHLGLDQQNGRFDCVLENAKVLSNRLGTSRNQVLVVDDINHLDSQSLAVLQAARRRYGWILIATALETERASRDLSAVFDVGREAIVELAPLHFDQVQVLLANMLGAAPHDETTTRIFALSGGNPKIAVRVADTGLLSGLLVLRRGQWHMTGDSLWNEHLRGTVEGLLSDLDPEEFRALRTVAMVEDASVEVLESLIDIHILDKLERRGFLRIVAGNSGSPLAAISPPVITDFFRRQATARERRLFHTSRSSSTESQQPRNLLRDGSSHTAEPSAGQHANPRSFGTLTERETYIASMAGLRTNNEIAEHLGISPRTVQNHIHNALRKTGTETRKSLYVLVVKDR